MTRFFSVTHCGMGVPPVIFVRARAGSPCHNASPTAHPDTTESSDLILLFRMQFGTLFPERATPDARERVPTRPLRGHTPTRSSPDG
jgi:hypothetical protein